MKFDPVPLIIGCVALIIATIIIVFAGKSGGTGSANTQETIEKAKDGDPKIEVSETTFLLSKGEKIKQKTVEVSNNGSGVLVLSSFASSCKCVIGQFAKASETGPEFFSRNRANWSTTLPSKEKGLLTIRFDEKSFNWSKPTDQVVSFKTNDLDNPEIKISFVTDPTKIMEDTNESGDSASETNLLEQLNQSGALQQEQGEEEQKNIPAE